MRRRLLLDSLRIGVVTGLVFGLVDLLLTWLRPFEADSGWVLLRFYGPMFSVWLVVSFRAARETRRLSSGVAAGLAVAFGTFCIFVLANFVRVNLFFDQLMLSPDWHNMMMRFRTSGSASARLFVNLDYIKGTPFKIGFFTALGGVFGILGGSFARLTQRQTNGAA